MSSSPRAREYRQLVEDVVSSGLLSDEERAELRDMLKRIQRKMAAQMPAKESAE